LSGNFLDILNFVGFLEQDLVVQIFIGLLNFICDWVLQFWKRLIKLTKIFNLLVSSTQFFVGLLIKLFEIIFVLMVLALEFNVESSDIGDKEISKHFVYFFSSNLLESIQKKQFHVLYALSLLVDIFPLKIGPIFIGFVY